MKQVGFIGAGNMATAIINGMLGHACYQASDVYVFDVNEAKLQTMQQRGIHPCHSAQEILQHCSIVFLAVKPQNYAEVLQEIKNTITDQTVLVSIAAGISSTYLLHALERDCAIVRVMPNTPLLLGQGATALCRATKISDEDFMQVYNIFAASGVVEILPEEQMNTVIAVNGSSPAYVYLFAKALTDYAVQHGIEESAALHLVCKTLEGSAAMLRESGMTAEELIRMVSSPGGTTLKAMDALREGKFYETILHAMDACTLRANELGK